MSILKTRKTHGFIEILDEAGVELATLFKTDVTQTELAIENLKEVIEDLESYLPEDKI